MQRTRTWFLHPPHCAPDRQPRYDEQSEASDGEHRGVKEQLPDFDTDIELKQRQSDRA
jgi:hypothetical protein